MNNQEPERHYDGCLNVNFAWVKREILRTYTSDYLTHNDTNNKLIISYNKAGYVMFALSEGGCVVYSPSCRFLIVIDAWGNKVKTIRDITVVGAENVI